MTEGKGIATGTLANLDHMFHIMSRLNQTWRLFVDVAFLYLHEPIVFGIIQS